jgi:hypothetical protein
MLLRGEYPTPEALLADAVKTLVRDQERKRIEAVLNASGLDDSRIEQLLQEAEDSGDYPEMTGQDWEDIEREGLALARARKSA